MIRTCPHCQELSGEAGAIVKLDNSIKDILQIGDTKFDVEITHTCARCKCLFGSQLKEPTQDIPVANVEGQ